jgi:hypothetical protein
VRTLTKCLRTHAGICTVGGVKNTFRGTTKLLYSASRHRGVSANVLTAFSTMSGCFIAREAGVCVPWKKVIGQRKSQSCLFSSHRSASEIGGKSGIVVFQKLPMHACTHASNFLMPYMWKGCADNKILLLVLLVATCS